MNNMQAVDERKIFLPKKVIIQEDTNHKVVQFMNMEGDEAELAFNAGNPLSQKNKSYLLRHGRFYNLPERLRRHIAGLGFPKYGDIEVPGFKGAKRSTIVGKTHRFALLLVEDPSTVVIEEHETEKIALKKLPGADTNTATIPGENMQVFVQSERLKEMEAQNEFLNTTISALTDDYNDLSGKFDKLMENLGEKDTKKVDSKKG